MTDMTGDMTTLAAIQGGDTAPAYDVVAYSSVLLAVVAVTNVTTAWWPHVTTTCIVCNGDNWRHSWATTSSPVT